MKVRPLVGRQVGSKEVSREISTRAADRAGGLLPEAHVEPPNLLLSSDDPFLILVHGYANSRDDAAAAYRKLTARLSSDWQSRAVHVFWPGDGTEPGGDSVGISWLYPFKSKLAYSWQPERATESARLISEVIADAVYQRGEIKKHEGLPKRPLAIHVVAHSLGCRLTLQLLRDLSSSLRAARGEIEIRLAVLMAGAVPLYLLADHAPLAAAIDLPARTVIYHSKRDTALGVVFRVGQAWESIKPFLPFTSSSDALGRRGIAEVPGRREVYHTAINHSDYWPSADIAADIAAALTALPGPPGGRLIQSRFSSERASPQPRRLGSRGVM